MFIKLKTKAPTYVHLRWTLVDRQKPKTRDKNREIIIHFAFFILTFALSMFCCNILFAEELPYLDVASKGNRHVDFYYGELTREIDIDIAGWEREFDLTYKKMGAQISYRPKLGWDLFLRLGQPKIELEYRHFKYSGDFAGYTIGAGFRYIFVGSGKDTPEISAQVKIEHAKGMLDEEKIRSTRLNIDNYIYITELSSSIIISKRICSLKPYAGISFYYADIDWKDNVSGNEYDGDGTGVNIILGNRFPIIPSVSLKVEGSFFDTESIWASLGISF